MAQHDFLVALTAVFSLMQQADCVSQQAALTSQQSAAAEPQHADGGTQHGACSAQQPELAEVASLGCELLYMYTPPMPETAANNVKSNFVII